jgi:hypothetical protein
MQMDLRFFMRAAVFAGAQVTKCLAAVLLFWASAAQASSGQSGSDYLYPSAARGGFLERVSTTQATGPSSKPAATTTYRSFAGNSYTLGEHRGRYVSVLVPRSVDEGPFFTADHLEELVDRLDELYALYRDILQFEPAGGGLLTVAFVPETCGSGCGLLGAKGIEIRSEALNYELIIKELDAGRLELLLVHEMVHNFDAYAGHLHYLPDHPHAWTDFFQYFAAYRYGRQTSKGEAPDDLFQSPVSAAWKDYIEDDTASWASCVKSGGCGDSGLSANNVWAMPYYRIEALYGTEAILRSFAFLTDYIKRFPAPVGAEAREALRIRSLAEGAGVNLACHVDSLKWPVPSELRDDMENRFGPSNPLCRDADGDGFVPIAGDCDENSPARNVMGTETEGNGLDDDCDGLTDEKSLVEHLLGAKPDNFVRVALPGLPFEAEGSSADSADFDLFTFPLGTAQRVRANLCAADGFRGWAAALDSNGDFIETGNYYVYQAGAGCSSTTFDFADLGSAVIAIIPDGTGGDYSLTVSRAAEFPGDHSVLLAAVPRAAGGVELQVSDPQGQLAGLGADRLEVWISGTDVRRTVPYSASASVVLDRASAPQLAPGSNYQARLRATADGQPVVAYSAGHLFRYDASALTLPQVDHRYSGAWFDPAHEGEGFIVEVLEDDRAVVYWFTYHADGRQRWLIGVGEVAGSRIVVGEMLEARGGRFGDAFDPDDVKLRSAGSLSISFQGCSDALVNYSIDDIGGNQDLTRLTEVAGHRCGASAAMPTIDLAGSWYDPAHNGEGFVVQPLENGEAAVFWFTYDANGEQAWLHNTGTIEGGRIVFPNLLQPKGGGFGRSFDPAAVQLEPWGELELQLNCGGGTAVYDPAAAGFSRGAQNLVNLTRLQNSGCGAP